MNALIIGGAGFVGAYLIKRLASEKGCNVTATKLPYEALEADCNAVNLDILDPQQVCEVLSELRPDCIFHLAAQSSVKLSWERPQLTVDVNIKGAVNVLEAVRTLDYKPKVLLIGSGEEYGFVREGESPVNEENPLRAGNIYAVTKACQNMLGSVYARAYGLDVIMIRAFNHIGAGQLPTFVVSDFCKQAAEIEKGIAEPVIKVGNLSAKRDFSDVRDVVNAYVLLSKHGKSGETYNVGSGKAVEIKKILDIVVSKATADIRIEIDPKKLRPVDVPVIEADISKITADTGWKPEISLEDTITGVLDYWRTK